MLPLLELELLELELLELDEVPDEDELLLEDVPLQLLVQLLRVDLQSALLISERSVRLQVATALRRVTRGATRQR